ncbi:hypothetical protein HY768_09175 [candidate division TA06 bacterium]|uniref:Uncharacterized protein n=1 Tax=candidate division TA06 bacterium TaxID=2250710 RepID=A0A933MLD3_UNCT6|nr:hypothetical protein [candidate division TA06 bacterium]
MRIVTTFIVILITSLGLVQAASRIDEIPIPAGYTAVEYPASGYSHWVTRCPLKSNLDILDHSGRKVPPGAYSVYAVLDLPPLFSGDLEQCADYAMRLWAEYHKDRNILDKLYLFDYNGRRQYYKASHLSDRNFLHRAFANSSSYFLKQGCAAVDAAALVPGDMVVQNERGGVGHVSVVLNVCLNSSGQKLYLLGFSYMPAQEFHVERALEGYGTEGWFTLEEYFRYLQDYMDLGTPVLRRFK